MNRSEKRFFKQYAARFVTKNTLLIELYNTYNKYKNEDKVKQYFNNISNKNFSVYKHKLYNLLVESIAQQNSFNCFSIEAQKQLTKALALYRKYLYNDCMEFLKRAIEYCKKHSCYQELLVAQQMYERCYFVNNAFEKNFKQNQKLFIEDMLYTSKIIQHNIELKMKLLDGNTSWLIENLHLIAEDKQHLLTPEAVITKIEKIDAFNSRHIFYKIIHELIDSDSTSTKLKYMEVLYHLANKFLREHQVKFTTMGVYAVLLNYWVAALQTEVTSTIQKVYHQIIDFLVKHHNDVNYSLHNFYYHVGYRHLSFPNIFKNAQDEFVKYLNESYKHKRYNDRQNLIVYNAKIEFQICNALFDEASQTISKSYHHIKKLPVSTNLFFSFNFYEILLNWRNKNSKLTESSIRAIKYQLRTNEKLRGSRKKIINCIEKINRQIFKQPSTPKMPELFCELLDLIQNDKADFLNYRVTKIFVERGLQLRCD